MFKITRTDPVSDLLQSSQLSDHSDVDMLLQLSLSETWLGDLATGVFKLGPRSMAMHGLTYDQCGLLSLIRCYESNDRSRILSLFEQASISSSSFCFSTSIAVGNSRSQPVFCIGESSGLEQKYSGKIVGTFIFPRFQITAPQTTAMIF